MNFVEIDIESFINTNAILLSMVVLVVSMVFTSLTVWLVNVSHKLAKKANPNALTRLLIYLFIEFIAFMFDVVFVAFMSRYTLPWMSLIWLGGIIIYSLFRMMNLLSNFGFSFSSFMKNIVALSKAASSANADPVIERLEEFRKEEIEMKKVKEEKGRKIGGNTTILFIVLMITFSGCISLRNSIKRKSSTEIAELSINKEVAPKESTYVKTNYVSAFSANDLVKKANSKRAKRNASKKFEKADELTKKEDLIADNYLKPNDNLMNDIRVEEPKVVVVTLKNKPLLKITIKEKD